MPRRPVGQYRRLNGYIRSDLPHLFVRATTSEGMPAHAADNAAKLSDGPMLIQYDDELATLVTLPGHCDYANPTSLTFAWFRNLVFDRGDQDGRAGAQSIGEAAA